MWGWANIWLVKPTSYCIRYWAYPGAVVTNIDFDSESTQIVIFQWMFIYIQYIVIELVCLPWEDRVLSTWQWSARCELLLVFFSSGLISPLHCMLVGPRRCILTLCKRYLANFPLFFYFYPKQGKQKIEMYFPIPLTTKLIPQMPNVHDYE